MDIAAPAGHMALDLVGTLRQRDTRPRELLNTPAELGDWLAAAGLLDTAPRPSAAELNSARELREALYHLLRAVTAEQPPPRAARRTVNAAAAVAPVAVELCTNGSLRRAGGVPAALASLARSAIELLGGPEITRIRWCAGETCTRPFLDRSRAGQRRWCGMAGCGDRAKARAYRARHREPR